MLDFPGNPGFTGNPGLPGDPVFFENPEIIGNPGPPSEFFRPTWGETFSEISIQNGSYYAPWKHPRLSYSSYIRHVLGGALRNLFL